MRNEIFALLALLAFCASDTRASIPGGEEILWKAYVHAKTEKEREPWRAMLKTRSNYLENIGQWINYTVDPIERIKPRREIDILTMKITVCLPYLTQAAGTYLAACEAGTLPPPKEDFEMLVKPLDFYLKLSEAMLLISDIRPPGAPPTPKPALDESGRRENDWSQGLAAEMTVLGRELIILGVTRKEPAWEKLGRRYWQAGRDALTAETMSRPFTRFVPLPFEENAAEAVKAPVIARRLLELRWKHWVQGTPQPPPLNPLPPGVVPVPVEEARKQDKRLEELTGILKIYHDAFSKGDTEAVAALLAPSFKGKIESDGPLIEADFKDRDGHIQAAKRKPFSITADSATRYYMKDYGADKATIVGTVSILEKGKDKPDHYRFDYQFNLINGKWLLVGIE